MLHQLRSQHPQLLLSPLTQSQLSHRCPNVTSWIPSFPRGFKMPPPPSRPILAAALLLMLTATLGAYRIMTTPQGVQPAPTWLLATLCMTAALASAALLMALRSILSPRQPPRKVLSGRHSSTGRWVLLTARSSTRTPLGPSPPPPNQEE